VLHLEDEVVDGNGLHIEGADAFIRFISEHFAGATTVHHGHSPHIEITGPGTATGWWALSDYVELAEGTPPGFRGYGYYDESYRKVDGRWLIARFELSYLRTDPLPARS
jgi:hypothetical protein